MPELPDVTVYVETLARRLVGLPLRHVRIAGVNLLRTVEPPPEAAHGRAVRGVRRIGKRVVLEFEGDLFFAFHLMIAGRFHWRAPEAKLQARLGLAALDFATGSLTLTEAGTRKRASLHVLQGERALRSLDAGGIEPLSATLGQFRTALERENHTLKRSLTDPRLFSGIGNAYSDEILHRAGLTAFREGMAVHGRYRQPCPVCGAPVQRIVYAENETNYCARCQTGGRVLADRSLSRLLKQDWPRTIEELEG